MEIRELPLDDMVLDPNLNLRDRLDDFTVERYAEAWQRLPPVTVFEVDGRWLLADGFHRHAAAVMLGRQTIPAEIRQGTLTDALDFVAGVNLFHGLPLTRSERRRAVEIKLRLHHDWSDRRLAEELGVSRELVAKTRRSLIEGGQIPNNPGGSGPTARSTPRPACPRTRTSACPRGSRSRSRTTRAIAAAARATRPPGTTRRPRCPPSHPRRRPQPLAHTPWGSADAKAVALAEPVPAAAPTIDEMLALMAKQIMEMITWTQAEGFIDAYRLASGNASGLFQTAVIKLAARADQLRKL